MSLSPVCILRKVYHVISDKTVLTMSGKSLAYGMLGVGLYTFTISSTPIVALMVFIVYLATGGYNPTDIFLRTVVRDLRALKALLQFRYLQSKNIKRKQTIPFIFEKVMRKNPEKCAVLWETTRWTYKDLHDYSNAVGNYFKDQGYQHGDVVSLFVENRPEYVALWLGLAKIGVVCALINYNLREDSLIHCINVSMCKGIVFSGRLSAAIQDVSEELKGKPNYYLVCGNSEAYTNIPNRTIDIDGIFQNGLYTTPSAPENANYFDKLLYIYTSGTTGYPKAAIITHCRYFYMCTMQNLTLQYKSNDNIYCVLPLYHSNGGIVGLGQMLCHGLTLTIRTKFSASAFWTDCKKYHCTVILYIGEICRYLLAQQAKSSDCEHDVRVMTGNGLRPEIWTQFVTRFNIQQVAEFYGATEGNASMINIDNTVGSCGFKSMIMPSVYPIMLLRIDEDKKIIRGRDGLCILCEPGEFGMLVGKIINDSPTQKYDGYVDKPSTNKKIAYDVLQKGDFAFLTGDIFTMNKYGYMFFKDRTGDTFRWKGENVSTAECEAEIAKVLGNKHTVGVYGVEIPGVEGKAGMACIMDPDRTVDLKQFFDGIMKMLASYARPLFVRICDHIEVTGTYKVKKVILREEGYDLSIVKDPIYFLHVAKKEYVPFDVGLYRKIQNRSIRL